MKLDVILKHNINLPFEKLILHIYKIKVKNPVIFLDTENSFHNIQYSFMIKQSS